MTSGPPGPSPEIQRVPLDVPELLAPHTQSYNQVREGGTTKITGTQTAVPMRGGARIFAV